MTLSKSVHILALMTVNASIGTAPVYQHVTPHCLPEFLMTLIIAIILALTLNTCTGMVLVFLLVILP